MPADPSPRRMIALQDRSGIDVTFLRSTKFAQETVDLVQLRRDDTMIIVAPSIPGDASCSGPESFRGNCVTLPIIESKHNNRARPRQNLLRVATFLFSARHVIHLTVRSFA